MRSLTIKLTLAFVFVGTIGAILVALLVGQRTRSEFDRFLSERDQVTLVQNLSTFYAAHGGWTDVATILPNTPPFDVYAHNIVLANAEGTVVFGNGPFETGETISSAIRNSSSPIVVNQQTVGYLVAVIPNVPLGNGTRPTPPDNRFLDRITLAIIISAVVATLIALLLGILLARTLTRPVRELTVATQALARGDLEQRVVVRSQDEIGELAQSFNQMSADLARASQMRKQMTADLAHDLRTPLSILRGYTEGLQDGRLKGTPAVYTTMHSEVEHLQRLVEDLRVLSLADAGELTLVRRHVDPTALLERTGLAYVVQAEQRGIALRVVADESLPSINVDTDRMTQVLNNLVSNALRYTSQGEIALVAHRRNEHVELQVRDTGSGIEAGALPFIFDRFYRADQARQRGSSANSGLGLAITKAIVEAHGGTIAVSSTPHVATVFTISLPVASTTSALPHEKNSEYREGVSS